MIFPKDATKDNQTQNPYKTPIAFYGNGYSQLALPGRITKGTFWKYRWPSKTPGFQGGGAEIFFWNVAADSESQPARTAPHYVTRLIKALGGHNLHPVMISK